MTPAEERELREDNEQLNALFDLRWKADMRARKRWQEATGKVNVWPDQADLTVWLLEKVDQLEEELRTLKGTGS